MSFGFSVGDFLSASQMVYSLYKALSDSTGSSLEYQQVIFELDCTHRIFDQLRDLSATNQISQACINGIGVIVASSVKLIEPFLRRIEKYRKSLSAKRTASQAVVVWRKIGWSIHKPAELVALKENLRSNQLNIMLLVVTATHHELTLDKHGYGPAIIKKLPPKDDFSGVRIFHNIECPPPDKWQLDPTFAAQKAPESFFLVGQVFAIIDDWDLFQRNTETEDPTRPFYIPPSDIVHNHYTGQSVIRRYVVIQEGVHGALCIGIHSYGNKGCMYEEDQDLHAIIYTASSPPPPQIQMAAVPKEDRRISGEMNMFDESGMTKRPIRMIVDHVSYALPPASRLHFGRVYKIKHNVRVKCLGVIHVDSITDFIEYSKSAQESTPVLNQVWKTVQKIKERFTNIYPKLEYPKKSPNEDQTLSRVKSMAHLKALCESDQTELFVIAAYDSDVHYQDHLSQQLQRHPNRLNFKKGDRIKVLNQATAINVSTNSSNTSTLDPTFTSDDITEPNITWWLGELHGLRGEFPWWYAEIE